MDGNRECSMEVVSAEWPVRGAAVFGAGFAGFQGHFEGEPILPGFCHVQLGVDLLRAVGIGGELREVSVGKFTRAIRPGVRVEVRVERGEEGWFEGSVWEGEEMCSGFTFRVGSSR